MVEIKNYRIVLEKLYKEFVVYRSDSIMRPDFYICIGPRIVDFSGTLKLEQIFTLIDVELIGLNEEDEILIVAAKNIV